MPVILGINAYHPDSSACLLVDGRLVAAVAEERLGLRRKHHACFPVQAIQYVLSAAGVTLGDVEHVAIGNDPNSNLAAKTRHVVRHPVESLLPTMIHMRRRGQNRSLRETLCEPFGLDPAAARFRIHHVEHHLAHVAGSFFSSTFEHAAGFTYDASGDFVSAMYADCRGLDIEVVKRVHLPDSLGLFYNLCQFIGFDRWGEEYKVMGLAAYGQPAYLDVMRDILRPRADGGFRLDPAYMRLVYATHIAENLDAQGEMQFRPGYTPRLVKRLGPPRVRGSEIGQRDKDVAASCQQHFEDVVIACLAWLHQRVPVSDLVTAGGCALNGVCNARVLRDSPFRRSYIQGAASDDGTALGAAQYVNHVVLRQPRVEPIGHAFWGPAYGEDRVRTAVEASGFAHEEHTREALLEATSDLLRDGLVVGWYQGRSEWGPRALGNRSILANPAIPTMKDAINAKIKRREAFRPFAPSVLAEHVGELFEQDIQSPFMMHVVKLRPAWRDRLPAVAHIDGTGRLQTVASEQNPLYYDLIRAFHRKTGIPALLNTSFNENEPIVDTPEQALDCFRRTDLDVLVLGRWILRKQG